MDPIRGHQRVVLTQDIAGSGLAAGDVGTVVHVYENGKGFEVEFFTLNGDTIGVETLLSSQLRSVSPKDVTHARTRVDAA